MAKSRSPSPSMSLSPDTVRGLMTILRLDERWFESVSKDDPRFLECSQRRQKLRARLARAPCMPALCRLLNWEGAPTLEQAIGLQQLLETKDARQMRGWTTPESVDQPIEDMSLCDAAELIDNLALLSPDCQRMIESLASALNDYEDSISPEQAAKRYCKWSDEPWCTRPEDGADTVSDTSKESQKKSRAKKAGESRHGERDARICKRIIELGRQGFRITAGVEKTAEEERMTPAAVFQVWTRRGETKKSRRKRPH